MKNKVLLFVGAFLLLFTSCKESARLKTQANKLQGTWEASLVHKYLPGDEYPVKIKSENYLKLVFCGDDSVVQILGNDSLQYHGIYSMEKNSVTMQFHDSKGNPHHALLLSSFYRNKTKITCNDYEPDALYYLEFKKR